MRPLFNPLLLALLLILQHPVCRGGDAADFFDAHFGSLPEETENARDAGKKAILIFFEMEECPFCHRMKQTILNRPEVQAYFREHFLILSIDVEGDIEIVDFQGNSTTEKRFAFEQNRVRATPVFALFSLEGKAIRRARFTGAASSVEEFMLFGRYLAEGGYQKSSFTRYKRELRKAPDG